MEARVSQSSRYGNITAFSGREYVKYEWRTVPAGFEEEAEKNPYLEIKPDKELAENKAQEQPPENAEQKPGQKAAEQASVEKPRRRK